MVSGERVVSFEEISVCVLQTCVVAWTQPQLSLLWGSIGFVAFLSIVLVVFEHSICDGVLSSNSCEEEDSCTK